MRRLTNEIVAEALGWEHVYLDMPGESEWVPPDPEAVIYGGSDLPNFLHDLNATFKYVWPELIKLTLKGTDEKSSLIRGIKGMGLVSMLFGAFESDKPALVIAEAFMKLKEKELTPT